MKFNVVTLSDELYFALLEDEVIVTSGIKVFDSFIA